MSIQLSSRRTVAGLFLAACLGAAGCVTSGSPELPPPPAPRAAPADLAPPAAAQVRLEPPPPERKLVPLPTAARRVLVLVTERMGSAATPRRDSESESIIAAELLSASGELGLEVVKKGTYDEILDRDLEALAQKGLDENAKVLSNLLQAGVDLFAMGEVGASELAREGGGGRAMPERFQVHAAVQLIRTDDARVLGVGNAEAGDAALVSAKTRALGEAGRRLVEGLRAQPPGSGLNAVTITVDGLNGFEEADRLARRLREMEGVAWSRELRFSAGAPGSPTGVARYEIGWSGAPDDLRSRITAPGAGVRLEITRVEGSRWNCRVVERTAAAPAPAATPAEAGKDR